MIFSAGGSALRFLGRTVLATLGLGLAVEGYASTRAAIVADAGSSAATAGIVDVSTIGDRTFITGNGVANEGAAIDTPTFVVVSPAGAIFYIEELATGTANQIISVNPTTGFRTALSGTFTAPTGMAWDAATSKLIVSDAGSSAATAAIISVDSSSGAQTVITGNGVANEGAAIDTPRFAVAGPDGTIYYLETVASGTANHVISVNPGTGFRTALGATSVTAPTGMSWNTTTSALTVSDAGTSAANAAILSVDPASGTPTVVSSQGVGSGSAIDTPESAVAAPGGAIYYYEFAASGTANNVIKVTGGARSVLSGSSGSVGTGTSFAAITSVTVPQASPPTISTATLPNWTVNKSGYLQTVTVTGGTGASTFAVTAGSLPTGLTLNTNSGVVSGTPTAAATYNFTITATDTVATTGSQAYTIIVAAAVSVSPSTLPNWTINKSGYLQTITSSGGTGSRALSITSGAIPTGMTFTAGTGILNGTPTAAGTFNFTITATDTVGATGSQAYTIVVNAAVAVSPSTLPNWTINQSGYLQTVTSSGGTGAKVLSITAGAIPTGMTFTAGTGILNGTPTAAGTFNFTITATDTVGATGSQAYTIVVNAAVAVSPSTLPNWTINQSGYLQTVTSSGGTGAKVLSITAGAIPTGMTFTAGTGILNGTPTAAGTFNFTITATDTVGATGSQAYTIIVAAAVSVSPSTLPNWTINQSGYLQTVTSSGGTGSRALSITSGAIPTGMTFTAGTGILNGAPTAAGTFNFTITATDTVGATGSQAYTIIVAAAVSVSPSTLPNWTINQSGYLQTVTSSGGTGSRALSITSGAIPTGMTFTAGTGILNGTPTAAGTFNFTITATDSVGATGSQAYTIVVNAAVAVSPATLPSWTINQSGYLQTVTSSGGTGSRALAITAGAIPTGMTFTAGTGTLNGTPTATGTFNFTVTATDTVGATGSQAYTIVINPAVAVSPSTLPNWTINQSGYLQTVTSSGGTASRALAITAGAIPTGMTFTAGTGLLNGTPTAAGTFNFTITATDTVGATGVQAYTIIVNPSVSVTLASLPNWTINQSGYLQTVTSSGGTGSRALSITSGAIPTGMTFTAGTGSLNGTPTAAGTFNFTITATDTVGATGSQAYTIIVATAVSVSPSTLPNWTINKSGYLQTIASSGGTGSRALSITAGAIPTGMTFTAGTGTLTGTPTAAATYNFTVTSTDTVGATGSQAYTIIVAAAVSVSPSTLPNWTINQSGYSQTITASGGTGAISLSVTAGAIPTGLTFTAGTGILAGTPTTVGTYNFTVSGTDTVGATAPRPIR